MKKISETYRAEWTGGAWDVYELNAQKDAYVFTMRLFGTLNAKSRAATILTAIENRKRYEYESELARQYFR